MKKNFTRVLAALLALMMVLALAACGGKETGSSSPSGTESSESSTSEGSEASAASTSGDKFATVKEFLEDPQTKAALEQSISEMEGEGLTASIDGTDDTLIYTFTFSEDAVASTDTETLKTALATQMDGLASVFEGIAGTLSQAIEGDSLKVVVIYATPDGTELFNQEYAAK